MSVSPKFKIGSYQGSRDGAVMKALASLQRSRNLIPAPGVIIMWVELWLILVLALRGFSPNTPVFPSPKKTNISKFQFDLESVSQLVLFAKCINK